MNILGLNSLGGGGLLSQMADTMLASSRNPVLMPNVRQLMPGQNNLLNPSSQMSNRLGSLSSDPLQASLLGLPGTGVGFDVSQVPTSVPNIPGVSADQALVNAFTPAPKTRSSGIGGFLSNMSPEMAFGIASSLLQGPTSLPVSTGKKLTSGLLTGMQLQRQAEQDKLTSLLTGAKITEALGKGGERQFSEETSLRKDFNSASKTYKDRVGAYKSLESLVSSSREKATPGTDMAIVYQYMKTMDPTSAVLQGEYASASQVGNLPTKLVNLYNSMVTGNSLRAGQREDFLRAAGVSLKGHFDTHQNRVKEYESLANSYGLRPSNIVSDPLGGEFTPPEAPVGDLFEGLDIQDGSENNPFFIMPDKNLTKEKAIEFIRDKKLPKGTYFKYRNENGTVVSGKVG